MVTLNQLVLEDAVLSEQIRVGMAEFAGAVHKTEARAGKVLAERVKELAAELRRELECDVEEARSHAAQIMHDRGDTRASSIRCGAAAGLGAIALFMAGLWIGANFLR